MQATLLYLLKAHVVLALFVAAYYGLLRQLTFFRLNRAYLLLALLFAAVYPALPMPGLLPAEVPAAPAVTWVLADSPATAPAVTLPPPAAPGPDWPLLALALYASGVAVLLGRLLVQLLALARLRHATRPACTLAGAAYRELPTAGDPFSFGGTIYLHAGQHSAAELAVIVAHEQAHVRQVHTLDVLLVNLGSALFWLSPAAWLLRRAVLDNLEYLADTATLRTGLDRRSYQYYLLKLSHGATGPELALPFIFLTLKNRIAMMNTPLSTNGQLARYFLAGPLLVLAALGYSAAHAREAVPVEVAKDSITDLLAPRPSLLPEAATTVPAPVVASKQPVAERKKPAFALPPAMRTYLAANYPQDKVMEIVKGSFTASGPVVYVALVGHQKTKHPFFDATGQFLGEKTGNFVLLRTMGVFTLATPISTTKPATTHPATDSPAGAVQTGPTPLYYLDGQAITEAQFKALKPNDISSVQVLKGEQARQMAGEQGRDGIVVVTSEANKASASVLEFNQRVQRYAPLQVAATKPPVTFALPTDALYYLDGKPSTRQAVEQLDQQSIANVETVKNQARIRRIPGLADNAATTVILVTTKTNADAPTVRAFAEQADLASAYTLRPVGVNVLRPAALAYITSHFPDARLNEVNEQKQKTTGMVRYQVQLINGKRPFYVYFTPEGEFLGE